MCRQHLEGVEELQIQDQVDDQFACSGTEDQKVPQVAGPMEDDQVEDQVSWHEVIRHQNQTIPHQEGLEHETPQMESLGLLVEEDPQSEG